MSEEEQADLSNPFARMTIGARVQVRESEEWEWVDGTVESFKMTVRRPDGSTVEVSHPVPYLWRNREWQPADLGLMSDEVLLDTMRERGLIESSGDL